MPNYRPTPTPADTAPLFTRRVLGLCGGGGPRWFPAFSTANPVRVRVCWAGDAFSGLMFSWSSWGSVCCNVSSAEPASRAEEVPNITARSVCGAKQRALGPADRPRPGALQPQPPAAARASPPAHRLGSLRTEEAAKGAGRHRWAGRV